MKKLAILTSILALAACSGGHHGGSAAAPILPDDTPIVDDNNTGNDSGANDNTNTETNTDTDATDNTGDANSENASESTGDETENTPVEDNTNPPETDEKPTNTSTSTSPSVVDPNMETGLDKVPTVAVIQSNKQITNVVSRVSNEAERTAYIKSKLGDDVYNQIIDGSIELRAAGKRATSAREGIFNGPCKSERECNDMIFGTMNKYLGGKPDYDSWDVKNKGLQIALKLAGCAQEVIEKLDEAKQWVRDNKDATDKVYEKLGQHQEFGITDVDLNTFDHEMAKLKFNVDQEGKIESIEYVYNDGIEERHDPEDLSLDPLVRDGDTNMFVEEHTITKEDMTDEDEYDNFVDAENVLDDVKVKFKHEYVSYAKKLGLKYSDFGVLTTDFKKTTFTKDSFTPAGQEQMREFLDNWGIEVAPFAGGYAAKQIDNERMQELANKGEIKFTGTAVGGVRYRDDTAYNGNGIDIPLTDDMMMDENATLVFDQTGKQVLTVDFSDNWYKFQAVKSADGTNQLIVINDDDKDVTKTLTLPDKDGKPTEKTYSYKLGNSDAGLYDEDGNTNHYNEHHQMTIVTGYYGDNNTPSEAVALVDYQYVPSDLVLDPETGFWHDADDLTGNMGVHVGFGGVKK